MSREIENTRTAFRKARKEGSEMLEQERITWDDFSFVMAGYEEHLKNLGVDF